MKEKRKRDTLLPELSQPSHVTIEPTRSISEIHVSGQTPIKMLVTKKGNQHKMNTPRTIPTKLRDTQSAGHMQMSLYTLLDCDECKINCHFTFL